MKKLLLCFILIPSISLSSVGTITFLKGTAWTIRDKHIHIIKKNDVIHSKDEIVTLKKSLLKIQMKDKTIFTIGPHSHLNFIDITPKYKKSEKNYYYLTHGLLRAHFSKKAKSGEIIVKTKHAAFGIRGTELILEVHEKNGQHISKLALLSGKINIHAYHPDKKHSKVFKMSVGHHFNSHIFRTRGLGQAYKKLKNSHVEHLNKNKDSFIHDVHHKNKAYTKYTHPKYFKSLKTSPET